MNDLGSLKLNLLLKELMGKDSAGQLCLLYYLILQTETIIQMILKLKALNNKMDNPGIGLIMLSIVLVGIGNSL